MFASILTLCIGNICRSPIAQCLLQAQTRQHGIRVESAGIRALEGRPADPQVVALMKQRGFDVSTHRARQVTQGMVTEANLILVMETTQRFTVEDHFPWARGKIYSLGHWDGFEIPDPYGQAADVFETVTELIVRGVRQWAPRLV
ncbi:MAG: low molecular weight protein-tyrosine-phosphatase [Gammaproteobacteria bacterium]